MGFDVDEDCGVERSGVRCRCGSEDSNADRADEKKLGKEDGKRLSGAIGC